MIVYYSEYSVFVVGDYVPKWLPKWASQPKTIMSDLRLRNGNVPFRNRKGCELGLYRTTWKRYITSQRDVVIPSMSAYDDLA